MSYRYDDRTKDQFAEDIKKSTLLERELMERYVKYLNERKNSTKKYTFIDNGVDNSGEYIEDDSQVSCDADFVLKCEGQKDRKVEIKHCRPNRYAFHLKTNHINHCIENDICIVNWMGVETDNPRFCILTPETLKESLTKNKHTFFWSKPVVKYICKDYTWYSA